jgi:hypothetical protein
MRSLTTLFEAEKNKKIGAKPVWILKCPFVAGTLYLSDRVFTYTGITIKPWIASWGAIDEDLSNQLTMPIVSDFSVDIIIDPDEATDIHDLLWSEKVETIDCELYLWFEGLTVATDPMKLIWTGNIIDFERVSELVYNVRLVDESVRVDKHPGRVLSLADYPNASLDDVGYQMPIVYGTVVKTPALRLAIGKKITLSGDVAATDIAISLTDGAGFSVGDLFIVDSEQIKVITIAGNEITSCWRGYNGDGTGTFSALSQGALVWSGMCAAINGDVYACVFNGDIYKQTAGAGAFNALSQGSRKWWGMCAAPNGDIYASVEDGDIYKQTGGTGNFAALSQTSRKWGPMCATPAGTIYAATTVTGDIYKLIAGTFTALSQLSASWYGLAATTNGDVYACVNADNIYIQTAGAGDFVSLGLTSRNWIGMCAAPNGDIYACVSSGDIYYLPRDGMRSSATLATATAEADVKNAAFSFAVDGSNYDKAAVDGTALTGVNIPQSKYGGWALDIGANGIIDVVESADNATGYASSALAIAALPVVAASHVRMGTVTVSKSDGVFIPGTTLLSAWSVTETYANAIRIITALSQTSRSWWGMAVALNGKVYAAVANGDIYAKPNAAAVVHSSGALIEQVSFTGVFLFADHPAKAIDVVYMINVADPDVLDDVTASFTKYTGQGGANDYAGYAGMAVVTCVTNDVLGNVFFISGDGYKDDGSGTFTGSAAALIERPDHIFKHFLYTQAAWPVADFSTDAATPFAADAYKFSMVINTRKSLKEWLAYMALQCRCWFRFAGGKAYLLYRPDSISSDKTIAKFADNEDDTTTMRMTRSPLDEIINVVHLYYQRDWSKTPGREAYQAVTKASNATSITAYGEKEKADMFLLDFIRDATMAADLRDFYLARYKDRKKVISGILYLDHCEVEFADGVTLTEAGALLCEVRKAGMSPGNANTMDKVNLIAREY